MTYFREFQSLVDSSEFIHPNAPGAHGVAGYCRVPGPLGMHNFSNVAEKFGALREIAHPLSPSMMNGGVDDINRIAESLAYGPEDIPSTMRKKGWHQGANLMEFRLNGAAKVMTEAAADGSISADEYGAYSTGIVTMDWVESFPRAINAINQLKTILNTPKARDAIKKRILANFANVVISEKTNLVIDNSHLDIKSLHFKWQFQRYRQGSIFETPDALAAALGRFNVMAAIRKAVVADGFIYISEVEIYIRDVFDFSGFQWLACWTESEVYRLGVAPFCSMFTNGSLRDYRIKSGRGMDFLVFSDSRVDQVDISFSML
ncbi:hypothetical protein HS961_16790 [Comamonas piscis]|uniref:Uncharacterized protein n=1 Tax=Comamonas piscis TaxID=1562974 RepID=A0A7G5EK31_9BURK|nr:DUF6402 family protein [Comamonas piscis]QMV74356.1 hypothetical protein HS961_16790 [Comamonas piscis]WSO32803.1 DUF6402 family protein [Comamonas piscis]